MGLVQDSEQFISDAWNAVEEMGGDIPPNKNLVNLPDGIGSIPTGPAAPTSLAELKQMVNRGREIVIGTEIPDTYAGDSSPLIVAQNLNSTNNTSYGGAEGVILIRKNVGPTQERYSMDVSGQYATSTIKDFLDTTYLSNCSDELRSIISQISIPYRGTSVVSRFFLMSFYEVCSNYKTPDEGIMWDYWKQKTGLSSPNNGANAGRALGIQVWLRSYSRALSGSGYPGVIKTDGSIADAYSLNAYGVLPACFIGKDN